MTPVVDRRTRKRLALRQTISDVATRLFFERGFDHVTVDDVARAADVGRMTVFNHFPRKEDMFFDQDEAARMVLLDAVRDRDPGVTPVEALRRLAHRLVADDEARIRFSEESRLFNATVAASDALKARARAIRDEVARDLAAALAASKGRPEDDVDAALAATLAVATSTVAFLRASEAFQRDRDADAAKALFLNVIDRGMRGVAGAMAGTPYAEPG